MKLTRFNTTHALSKAVSSSKKTNSNRYHTYCTFGDARLVQAGCWRKHNLHHTPLIDRKWVLTRQEGSFNSFALEYYPIYTHYELNSFNPLPVSRTKLSLFWFNINDPIFLTSLTTSLSRYLNLRTVLALYVSVSNIKHLTPYVTKYYHQGFYDRQVFSNFNIRYL